jgi:phage regulator Rha-like protein
MSELSVSEYGDGFLVVDSRLIAERLGIEHENFIGNIKKYQIQAEQAFGFLRFQTGEIQGRGRPSEYAFLTEEQATFYMTLSRNTPEVVQCKIELVQKFIEAKSLLRQRHGSVEPYTLVYIRRLENMADHEVPDDLWTTFREGAEILLTVEKQYKVPVDQMDLCDGSIGSHWSKYRQTQFWASSVGQYTHKFRDHRGKRPCRAYQFEELPHFRRWLREEYVPKHLPEYLADKYGKRAVYQIYEELGKLSDRILELTQEKRLSPKQEELYQVFLASREAIVNRYSLGE